MNRRGILLILAVFAGGLVLADRSAVGQVPPSQLKAVWLSYLGRYVTWPANAVPGAGGNFVVGVVGANPYGKFTDSITKKPIKGKTVVVRYFESMEDYTPCHILLVSPLPNDQAARQRLRDAINVIMRDGNSPVLLVSDTPGSAQIGSMVNYSIGRDGRIYLEVNKAKAERSGLRISAPLLKLNIVRHIN